MELPSFMNTNSENTFHLGITMAGAVSAGAYSAGFMDYLFEVLDLWEEKKLVIRDKMKKGAELNSFEKKIPLHNVCIDVFGGASAGGMVGVISSLYVRGEISPVKNPTDHKTGNLLYDSWVLMDNNGKKESTFEKMLKLDDIRSKSHSVPSLLNSKPIDKIANQVFDIAKAQKNIQSPSFVSKDLRLILTLCSLRSIPFELNFGNYTSSHFPHSPGHQMNEHMILAHFKANFDKEKDEDVFLNFDPKDDKALELLQLCTKATGAFPFGLSPRHFENKLSKKYIENYIHRNLPIADKEDFEVHLTEEYFDFTNVDGGTINNEPYAEVVQTLEQMNPFGKKGAQMFGTIMVDPFPNFYDQDMTARKEQSKDPNIFQRSIWEVFPKFYKTLREQVLVKHDGSFYKDYFRLLVFPVKWEERGKLCDHPPLSCAALGGFGGFLDLEFRKHDFFLGRNNARNFLRAYLMLHFDENDPHPLFKDLKRESIKVFHRKIKDKIYVPIIPDINLLYDIENGDTNPLKYTIRDFPKLDKRYFNKIKPDLKKRVKRILTAEINARTKKKPILRRSLKSARGYISRKLTKEIINYMRKDLEKRKMI